MNQIQCEDIISLEKPKMPTLSSDGILIAYVVERSDIHKNCIYNTLYIFDRTQPDFLTSFAFDKIKNIQWNGDTCYFVCYDNQLYKIIKVQHGKTNVVLSSTKQISSIAVSVDGSEIYFSQLIKTSEETVKKATEEGYVYRWGMDSILTINNKKYSHYEWEEIWCLNTSLNKTSFITKLPWSNWIQWEPEVEPLIVDMCLSPKNTHLAITLNRLGNPAIGEAGFQFELVVFDIIKNVTHALLADHRSAKLTPCWINDKILIFQEADYNQAKEMYRLWEWNSDSYHYKQLTFFNPNESINAISRDVNLNAVYVETMRHLYQLSLTEESIKVVSIPDYFFTQEWLKPALSSDNAFNWIACVAQDRENAPQVHLYDRLNKQIMKLTMLNQHLSKLSRGKIEEITFNVNDNTEITGYLIHPTQLVNNKKYPLLVATYGFKGNSYAAVPEEWHSSFPAQVFSAEGYFVLLLNRPRSYAQSNTDNSEEARKDEGWNMLAAFEYAVDQLVENRLIDANKIGIYGWSHGAFIAEFVISHSQKFKVAAIGEGGDYNPSGAWVSGNATWLNIYQNMFGGPPWGESLKNYLSFSPFFQVDKITAPLLMEFAGDGVLGLEMYTPLRFLNIPAELVLYPGEEHNFIKPKARLASMQRKIDWFNYWFFDKRSPHRDEQYARWDVMKKNATCFKQL